jgi:hypothetical protein
MFWVITGGAVLILIFGGVVLFGAPYLPTLTEQQKAALKLLSLEEGQTLIDLGSGDGTILLAAARQGIKAIGYELNPILVLVSLYRTRKYRQNVQIIWGNYWHKVWPRTDALYVFLLDRYMESLNNKIIQNYPEQTIKLASLAFQIPNKKPVKQSQGVYLYEYLPQKGS